MVYTDSVIEEVDVSGTLILMDTDREKEIGLGPDYPFEPLKAGECIVSSEF